MGKAGVMKTALLHYWLTNMRGGEKVFAALRRMLPDSDVFTHAYRPFGMPELDGASIHESPIARLPCGRRHPERYLPLMPLCSRLWNFDGYDLIVSSESGPVKGIRKPSGTRHVCYCHTPMRYVWDLYEDYYRASDRHIRMLMGLTKGCMRRMDQRSAETVDAFVANSSCVADRIRRIYGRDSVVVHPPVDVDFFSARPLRGEERSPYYLYAGSNAAYKRLDLAVEACERMGRRLVVTGSWFPREFRGRAEWRGRVSDEELRRLYAGAEALIFPGVEDFGIVAVEAQAAGTPVIALGQGGALDTVVDGETGLFFHKATVDSLCGAIEEFEGRRWNPDACLRNARQFTEERFVRGMGGVLRSEPVSPDRDLKIIVATHKPYGMPSDPEFLPLQVGAATGPKLGYARDDAGPNISAKNASYCELTGLYWAWKNLSCDCLGLVHYRRHFRKSVGEMRRLLRTTGCILPTRRNYLIETNYSHYIHAHHVEDMTVTREFMAERHPDCLAAFDMVMARRTGHRFNMFVMRRDFVEDYCAWLFGVLEEVERRLDISSYSDYDRRVFGFLSERLLDVWLERNRIAHVDVPIVNLESQHWPSKIFSFLRRKLVGHGRRLVLV